MAQSRRELGDMGLDDSQWLLRSFCSLNRAVFDPTLFAQRFPAPVSPDAFAQAARELGLQIEHRSCSLDAALVWRLPLAVCPVSMMVRRRPSARPCSGCGR
jgi:hypothetical protein